MNIQIRDSDWLTVALIDLPQVDHGGGRARGREGAGPERRSREWSTCVACRNLNRIKNFGANNFDIKGCVYFIQLLHRADNGSTKTQTHSQELIFLCCRMKQFAPSVETK